MSNGKNIFKKDLRNSDEVDNFAHECNEKVSKSGKWKCTTIIISDLQLPLGGGQHKPSSLRNRKLKRNRAPKA